MMAPLRFPAWRLALIAYAVLFAFSEVTLAWQHWGLAGRIYTYTGFIPLQAGVAWALFRAGRRVGLPEGMARALRWFSWAFVSIALGSITLAVVAIPLSNEPKYSLADVFYLSSYPLLIAGFLSVPRVRTDASPRSRKVLDLAVLVLLTGVLIFTHRYLRADFDGLADVVATITPGLAVIALLAANSAITAARAVPSLRAWRTLAIAFAGTLLVDIVFQTLWATGYTGPNWGVPLFVAVDVAVLVATWWFEHDPIEEPERDSVALHFSPLPMLLAMGGAAVLLLVALRSGVEHVQAILIALILLNVVLVAREFFLVIDTSRLVRTQTQREGERRFEALVRHSTDLMIVLDASHVVAFASPAVESLLGTRVDEVVGKKLTTLVHPDDVERVTHVLDALLLRPGAVDTAAWRLYHTDGTWRWFETNAANQVHVASVHGLVLNARDVTERLRLEEQLRQAQKMEVVGQLAGGVAHDFNNLLTTVMASSELALQDLPPVHPIRVDLEDIRRAAQRGAALTSRLLAFARPRGASARVVDVAERVRSLLPLLRRLLGEHVGVTPDIAPTCGAARLDPDELEHALLNLVANARDAMPTGGTVVVRCYERTLERALDSSVLSVPSGRYVVVEIADAGSGMTRETMERLFTPFFTTKETGKGTGLGLAGVLAFVKRSGGGLTVASSPGQGSTFALWFPRVAAHVGEAEDFAPPPSLGQGTILLLEDDDAVRSAARRILASAGYSVIEASSAAEARQRFAECQGHIDLLVADVIMPGESGASLAAALRRQRPDLHVLFVSGYPGADLERLGLREGEVELLRKPYTMQELRERVQEALDREGVLAKAR